MMKFIVSNEPENRRECPFYNKYTNTCILNSGKDYCCLDYKNKCDMFLSLESDEGKGIIQAIERNRY